MITRYKNRKINKDTPVQVYRNLTKKCWSIRQDRLVVGHAQELYLTDCTFTVIEKYRQRVITTGCKNVHAWVTGYLNLPHQESDFVRVTYNPYTHLSFTHEGNKVSQSKVTLFKDNGKLYASL